MIVKKEPRICRGKKKLKKIQKRLETVVTEEVKEVIDENRFGDERTVQKVATGSEEVSAEKGVKRKLQDEKKVAKAVKKVTTESNDEREMTAEKGVKRKLQDEKKVAKAVKTVATEVPAIEELHDPWQKSEDESSDDDENFNDVTIPATMRHESVYDKSYYCKFCEAVLTKLSRHLQTVHKTEPEVSDVLNNTTKKSVERRRAWGKLEKQGAFIHNMKVIENQKGVILVQKRPSKGSVVKLTDYRACPECKGFYCKETLRVHLKECSKKEYTVKEIKRFYSNLFYGKNQDKLTSVLSTMKEDNITACVKSDQIIMKHGSNIYEGFNFKRESEVSYRMRLVGRVLCQVRETEGKPTMSMNELIHPSNFDSVVRAVEELAQIGPGKDKSAESSVPSTALKFGHELKHCTDVLILQAIRESDEKTEKRGEKFKLLHEKEWGRRISKHALKGLEEKKKSNPIPFTDDIKVRRF